MHADTRDSCGYHNNYELGPSICYAQAYVSTDANEAPLKINLSYTVVQYPNSN